MAHVQDTAIGFNPAARWTNSVRSRRASRTAHGVQAPLEIADPTDVLCAQFPVLHRMLGEPSFRAVVRRFAIDKPPRMPIPQSYGESFPDFLRRQGEGGAIDYVADIATLEAAVWKARGAAHARPLGARAASSLQAGRLAGLRLLLHPSACLVQSRFPIVTIWKNGQGRKIGTIDRWRPESALIARPFRQVEVRCLPPGGYPFLLALAQGQTMATAAGIAAAATSRFELSPSLTLLRDASVVVDVRAAA